MATEKQTPAHDPSEVKEAAKVTTTASKTDDQLNELGLQLNRGAGTPHGADVHYPADHETWNRRGFALEPRPEEVGGEETERRIDERQQAHIAKLQERNG